MSKKILITLFLSSIMLVANSAEFPLTVTCQKCSLSTCSYANCFRVKADGYDTQVCGTINCDTSFKASFVATQCSTNDCESGVCLSNGVASYCDTGRTTTAQCSPPTWLSQVCGSCTQSPNCKTNCRKQTSSYMDYQQICQSTCTDTTPQNSTSMLCSMITNQAGGTCPCCYQETGYQNTFKKCTSQNEKFDTSNFNSWALGKFKTINANIKSNFGENIQTKILFVLLGLILVILG